MIAYVGKDLHSIKWRSFKIHIKTMDHRFAPVESYSVPPMYNLKTDPGEQHELMNNGKMEYTWVYAQLRKIMKPKIISMKVYPNIKTGQNFNGYNFFATKMRQWVVDFKTR